MIPFLFHIFSTSLFYDIFILFFLYIISFDDIKTMKAVKESFFDFLKNMFKNLLDLRDGL